MWYNLGLNIYDFFTVYNSNSSHWFSFFIILDNESAKANEGS